METRVEISEIGCNVAINSDPSGDLIAGMFMLLKARCLKALESSHNMVMD